jgi:hypothetical protein
VSGVSIAGRHPARQMVFLLRELGRTNNAYRVARPTALPTGAPAALAPTDNDTTVRIGDWTLHQDADTGDLVATNSTDGTTAIVARRGGM